MSTMSEGNSDRGVAVLTMGEETSGRGFKKAVEALASLKPKPDRGFRQAIDDAIAVVEAEWKAQRERELAERNQLEKARQKAMIVRELMIVPLLNDLCEDFATDEAKVLPKWQVESDGTADTFSGMAVTPSVNDSGPTCFTIRAEASVVEQGATLNLSVACSCIDAKNMPTGKVRQIHEKTKTAAMVKFDELSTQIWFHRQLQECARMCVLTRMRQSARSDADSVPQDAVGV